MLIAFLLSIRVYYIESNGYDDATVDFDDTLVSLFSIILMVAILLYLGSSILSGNSRSGAPETETR